MKQHLIAREGWPFIASAGCVAVLGWLFGSAAAQWVGFAAVLFCTAFFRNPHRRVPSAPGLMVSPADGRIVQIEEHEDPYFARGRMQRISVFLSVADVHMNRTPIAGEVKGVKYVPGQFRMAFRPEASSLNERNAVWIENDELQHEVVFVQIAGTVARRIVCYVQPGHAVERGQRYGLIRFGSRMDIYVPKSAGLRVKVGDRVVGGETILAQFATEGTS